MSNKEESFLFGLLGVGCGLVLFIVPYVFDILVDMPFFEYFSSTFREWGVFLLSFPYIILFDAILALLLVLFKAYKFKDLLLPILSFSIGIYMVNLVVVLIFAQAFRNFTFL